MTDTNDRSRSEIYLSQNRSEGAIFVYWFLIFVCGQSPIIGGGGFWNVTDPFGLVRPGSYNIVYCEWVTSRYQA